MKFAEFVISVLVVCASSATNAAPLRVEFAGVVSGFSSNDDIADPAGFLGGSIQIGAPFSGYFTIDDSAARAVVDPAEAGYLFRRHRGQS